MGMRKSILLLASMALAMLLVSGVAYAITKNCQAGADYCIGTDQADTLNGSDVRDKIYGLAGDDQLLGNGGNDSLNGGDDNDTLKGGDDTDRFNGGPGNDTLAGGPGLDNILATTNNGPGGPGNDRVFGGSNPSGTTEFIEEYLGRNLLSGGAGDDYLYGHDRLDGGSGDDELRGSHNYGTEKTRTITGGSGTDKISSDGPVEDTIYATDGEVDTVSCGPGTDTVYFDRGIDSINPLSCERRIAQ